MRLFESMEDIIRNNASVLYDGVPTYIYWGLLILFCFGVLLFLLFFSFKESVYMVSGTVGR
jgi:hypothetical protein